ncbi:MAG: vitamin B12-dependent ribonucleotide reductase [Candidatus Delongbacteria bacterium]|nr:vitamin B12-dependent ribonucleotide reductase [Candidatus Delongbacteria bacterium]
MEFSDNALVILEKRYLIKDLDTKQPKETPRDLFIRVAKAIAGGSRKANPGITDEEVMDVEDKFYAMMANKDFLPNSPTLMNAGRELPNLSACFVLPVEDSMEGIFNAVKEAALIHKSGGGTGFDFSNLRPSGANVQSTAGTASGPISFMSVFNAATETIKQGGVRRGANMGIMRVDHPEVMEFIKCKEDTSKFTNFNISVAVTDEFMKAYKEGTDYTLYHKEKPAGAMSAKKVMDSIVHHAWSTGEPGLIFIDKVNAKNTLPGVGKIAATNPCGEQPLLPYGSCNLGSINVSNFFSKEDNSIDWERLKEVVYDGVLFLDNVIEVGKYPIKKIHDMARANRNIGLGVMGFADLLYKLGLPYDSDEGVTFGKQIMAYIHENALEASKKLAGERGIFPNIDKSIYTYPIRNSNVTTVAPTGTIGMLAETSGGIEPNFALVYVKQVMDDKKLLYINPVLEETLKERGLYSEELMEKISQNGRLADIKEIPEDIKKVFVTAQEIDPYYHVAMQSAFQEFVDSSISKTINFDNSATEDDIKNAYIRAFDSACKGITVYRDGCRPYQVMNTGTKTNEDRKAEKEDIHKPKVRPDIMEGKTYKVNTGEGAMYVTVNTFDGKPFELFASIGKAGGNAAAQSEAISRMVSLALRSDIDLNVIIKQLIGIGSPTPVWHNGEQILSTPDAIGKILKKYYVDQNKAEGKAEDKSEESKISVTRRGVICPKCNNNMSMQEGCMTCQSCGYSKCS